MQQIERILLGALEKDGQDLLRRLNEFDFDSLSGRGVESIEDLTKVLTDEFRSYASGLGEEYKTKIVQSISTGLSKLYNDLTSVAERSNGLSDKTFLIEKSVESLKDSILTQLRKQAAQSNALEKLVLTAGIDENWPLNTVQLPLAIEFDPTECNLFRNICVKNIDWRNRDRFTFFGKDLFGTLDDEKDWRTTVGKSKFTNNAIWSIVDVLPKIVPVYIMTSDTQGVVGQSLTDHLSANPTAMVLSNHYVMSMIDYRLHEDLYSKEYSQFGPISFDLGLTKWLDKLEYRLIEISKNVVTFGIKFVTKKFIGGLKGMKGLSDVGSALVNQATATIANEVEKNLEDEETALGKARKGIIDALRSDIPNESFNFYHLSIEDSGDAFVFTTQRSSEEAFQWDLDNIDLDLYRAEIIDMVTEYFKSKSSKIHQQNILFKNHYWQIRWNGRTDSGQIDVDDALPSHWLGESWLTGAQIKLGGHIDTPDEALSVYVNNRCIATRALPSVQWAYIGDGGDGRLNEDTFEIGEAQRFTDETNLSVVDPKFTIYEAQFGK